MRKTMIHLGFAAMTTITASVAVSGPAQAQSATYLGADSDSCAIFRAISHEIPQSCSTEPATRGLVTFVNQPAGGQKTRSVVFAGQEQTTVQQSALPSDMAVAMQVHFEYDSARLTPQAHQLLDKVGAVLSNEIMQEARFRIEGHADQRGEEAYNMTLSNERARAVADYLIQRHNVDPYRLFIVGKGESAPFDPANPDSAVNRRVEFWNLGG